jgi:hypothetical protein
MKLMRIIKPLKITSFVVSVLFAAYYLTVFQAYICKELNIYKRKLVAQVIEEDLSTKDLTVDIKSKSTKPLGKLTVDDLRKAIWVLNVRNGQLQDALDTVKSALDYHQGEE